jgi:hypothetical protein
MITGHKKKIVQAGVITFITLLAITATAYSAPVKYIPSNHNIGTGHGTNPSEFSAPESVTAGGPNKNIYVIDRENRRVQEFAPNGEFVLMFGKDVNKTTGGNTCTAASKNTCQAGTEGAAPGQFSDPSSITVDPTNGDIYIAEHIEATVDERVQKFTAEGEFLLEIGKEVNKDTKGNLCTQTEIINCTEPTRKMVGVSEHGSFNFETGVGSLLAVGGEHDLLYVGDEHRVQEFESDGEWAGEIPLTAISSEPESVVKALTVNDETGTVFVVYGPQAQALSIIRPFGADGEELKTFEMIPREPDGKVSIGGMAIDNEGHLAVVASEIAKGQFGSVYESTNGLRLTNFVVSDGAGVTGIGFSENAKNEDELDMAATQTQNVLRYEPERVAELHTGSYTCVEGAEVETSVMFTCKLTGTVNPFEVAKTNFWFQYGRTCALGSSTSMAEIEPVEIPLPVNATIENLRPKDDLCYRLVADDVNVPPPELLEGEKEGENPPLFTPTVPAKIIGRPNTSFIKTTSAIMSGELNPENTNTRYDFLYGPCAENLQEQCSSSPYTTETTALESGSYGKIGASIEATGLQPNTTYHYRLNTGNPNETETEIESRSGVFTTAPAPTVEAQTGPFNAVTTTSAIVSGTVTPDGQPATYSFELGIYRGAATQYGTVFSGPTSTFPETETLPITGLHPGTEYAYRIKIASGYGSATGATTVFKTEGLPTILPAPISPPLLPLPPFQFEKPPLPACKKGYQRNKQNKCAKTKTETKKEISQKKTHKKKKK